MTKVFCTILLFVAILSFPYDLYAKDLGKFECTEQIDKSLKMSVILKKVSFGSEELYYVDAHLTNKIDALKNDRKIRGIAVETVQPTSIRFQARTLTISSLNPGFSGIGDGTNIIDTSITLSLILEKSDSISYAYVDGKNYDCLSSSLKN